MTSTEMTPIETFQEKVKTRLKKDISDLLPDEVLTSLIEKSIHEMFFEDRQVPSGHGGYNREMEKSWFNQAVKEAMAERLDDHIKLHIQRHKEEIDQKITKTVSEAMPQVIARIDVSLQSLVDYLRSQPMQ